MAKFAAAADAARHDDAQLPPLVTAEDNALPAPHGGVLTPRLLAAGARPAPFTHSLAVDALAAGDLAMLAVGAYAPLTGFMGADERQRVSADMRLLSGTLWPIPITLGVDEHLRQALQPGMTLGLTDAANQPLATLEVTEIYRRDVEQEALAIFGTLDPAHPGVAQLLQRGPWCVAGPVTVLVAPQLADFPALTPAQTRAEFAARGWRRVVGFQTRNPIHRAHEYLLRCALEICDGLLLHPLLGATKQDDIPAQVRQRCYEALVTHALVPERVLLSGLLAPMRYAGPREAVLHALVRKNFGCSHFIVGRDHAGVGTYYDTYAAQAIFTRFTAAELGISILPFENSFFCRDCAQMATRKTCPHGTEAHLTLSGTEVRRLLKSGQRPPATYSRPEVADILINWAQEK